MKKIALSLIVLIGLFLQGPAQNIVKRNDTVKVFHNGIELEFPWVGGLNAAHISELDFNLDGLMDLFIFEPNRELNEKTGDKILPFINTGGSGSGYRFAPEYRSDIINAGIFLERLTLMRDYNCDGKMDIFTHDVRDRITIYKNVSTSKLEFEFVTDVLVTDTAGLPAFFGHPGEIFWNYEDVIAIDDIDRDGDLDILTIDFGGSFIEYHKNMSMEKYGHCDSLHYKLKSTCWGRFGEDFGLVTFDTCNPYGNVPNPEIKKGGSSGGDKGAKHSNTSLLSIDLDGDEVKDIIAGDGIRNHLYMFSNGGKKDSAHMVSYEEYYPVIDSVYLTMYGIPFYVDVDHDNKKDLIVTIRNDELQDTNTVWFYKNTGSTGNPTFSLQEKGLFQNEMIDVGSRSSAVFFDYNQDSLLDIVVGNYGYFKNLNHPINVYSSRLALYENTGSLQAPEFTLIDADYAGISKLKLDIGQNKASYGHYPTFGDLDGDGDEDMILGDYRGKLHYFTNTPVNGKASFTLDSAEFQNIDVGYSSTPQLFDVDSDGKLDLLVGESDGNVNYFRNESNGSLVFNHLDDSIGNFNVKEYWDWTGYSSPFMYFDDSLQTLKMLVGTKIGFIQLYDDILDGDTLKEKFNRLETSYQDMWDGNYASINGGDLNNDGSLDFVLGNQSGGITIYTSEDSIYIPGIDEKELNNLNLLIYPNPTSNEINLVVEGASESEFDYSVLNAMGQNVLFVRGGNKITLNLGGLHDGIYFVRAENKNRSISITERFVKIK